jgi:hypothetical protein
MHSSNTCDMYEGFCIGCKNTADSFLFLFPVSLPPPLHNPRSMRLIFYYHYLASPHSFLQQATPHIHLRNVFQRQREKQPNEF